MAGGRLVKGPVPNIPAVEIIDLTSDDESEDGFLSSLQREANRDAPVLGVEDEEEAGEDQWESESLYEEALEEMEDDRLFDAGEQPTQRHQLVHQMAHPYTRYSSRRLLHS